MDRFNAARTLACAAMLLVASDGYSEGTPPAPFGYERDARGRLLQTSFDLRRRYFVGVGWAGLTATDDWSLQPGVVFEVGGTVEHYDEYESRRHRFRFLEGKLQLAGPEGEGLLFGYDRGRTSEEAQVWITTLVGKPRRYDLNIDIGPGLRLGRFWAGPIDDSQMVLIDILQGHLNWEMFQSSNLEDYLLVRFGMGVGVRFFAEEKGAAAYLYPEVAVEWAWLMGARGLTQLKLAGRVRTGWEPASGGQWYESRVGAGIERVLVAVNDQPISVYVEPALHRVDLPSGRSAMDVRFTAGGRLSLFVPPRDDDDRCPSEVEDFDGFEDGDGCADPDNDGDGIVDLYDACPGEPEDFDGEEDGDGCAD